LCPRPISYGMSKDAAIIILGFLVAAMPFLGFPSSWKTVFYVLLGLGTVVFALLLRKELLAYVPRFGSNGEKKTDAYTENGIRDKRYGNPHSLNPQSNRTSPPKV